MEVIAPRKSRNVCNLLWSELWCSGQVWSQGMRNAALNPRNTAPSAVRSNSCFWCETILGKSSGNEKDHNWQPSKSDNLPLKAFFTDTINFSVRLWCKELLSVKHSVILKFDALHWMNLALHCFWREASSENDEMCNPWFLTHSFLIHLGVPCCCEKALEACFWHFVLPSSDASFERFHFFILLQTSSQNWKTHSLI